jgi:acyl-CoA synthetase (AMP-forming)/AMP-acid ligase II
MSQLTRRLFAPEFSLDEPCLCYEGVWCSRRQLFAEAERLGARLAILGIQPGDRVVVGFPNSLAFVVAYLALIRYGAVVAPCNPEMPTAELLAFLHRSRAVAGFFMRSQWMRLQEAKDATDLRLRVVLLSDDVAQPQPTQTLLCEGDGWRQATALVDDGQATAETAAGAVSRSAALTASAVGEGELADTAATVHPAAVVDDSRFRREPEDEALGVLMYTSGTTGTPKAVGLRHRHLLAAADNVIASHLLGPADVTYCFLPMFHINAQVIAFLATLVSGGRIVLASKFSASRFWPTVLEYGVTWVSAVPTIIAILLKTPRPERIPSHLRFIRSASAPLPVLDARRFEREFGIPLIQSYGMTEAASQICVNPLPPGERKLGSVGRPVGVELQVMDDEGRVLGPGQVGEIVIRGRSVIDHYEGGNSLHDFRDGWFLTGDLGYVDADGYVFLTGRKKEMINRAGEKISPYEVEDVIREHPRVRQVGVVGLPDPLYGERVTACVVSDATPSDQERVAAEILELCRAALSRYKWPAEVRFVETIPVGPTGKVQRARLKQQLMEGGRVPAQVRRSLP